MEGKGPAVDNNRGETQGNAPVEFHQVNTRLNPLAKEWNPMVERATEGDRCLFLTFSNGHPLTEHQIINFFTGKYGACVERVYIHRRSGTALPPLFGKVVFNASYIPAMILGGKDRVKFTVDTKTLWCRRFEQNKKSVHGEN